MAGCSTLSLSGICVLLMLAPLMARAECAGIVHFGADLRYDVEIMADGSSRAKGLMFRKELAAEEGMLFVYPEDSKHHFWMKNTLLPLDILFYQKSGALNNVAVGAVPFDETSLPGYGAFVLEVNAGEYAAHQSEMGNLRFELSDGADCPDFVSRLSALN